MYNAKTMLNLKSAFSPPGLSQLVVFEDDERSSGFYVFPRSPRVALSDDGRPQLGLMVYGRKEGDVFHATGAILSLTTTLQITEDEDRALRAALSTRLIAQMPAAPERPPVVDLLGADIAEARVEVRITGDVKLTGRPSQFGGCPCTFQLKLDAARAQAVSAAWGDGLRDSAIRYELRLPIAGSTSVEVRATDEEVRAGERHEASAALDWSYARVDPGSVALTFEGPVTVPLGALTDLMTSMDF